MHIMPTQVYFVSTPDESKFQLNINTIKMQLINIKYELT